VEVFVMTGSRWADFERFVHQTMVEHLIPGAAIAVWQDGAVVYSRGFGLRCRESHEPVLPDTVFGVASISKSFTVMALARLQDRNLLSLDDPVVRHLPEFQIQGADMGKIRIYHLLSHTTGLPPLAGLGRAIRESMKGHPTWDGPTTGPSGPPVPLATAQPGTTATAVVSTAPAPSAAPVTIAGTQAAPTTPDDYSSYLRYLGSVPVDLYGPPGECFSYSNDSYVVAGALVERVSGMPYLDFMRTEVFAPLGLTRTTFSLAELAQMSNVTRLYFNNKRGETLCVPQWQDIGIYAAGGGIKSTVMDLVKYASVYATGGLAGHVRFLSEDVVKRIRTPLYRLSRSAHYACGLQVTPDYSGMTLVEHGGSLTGVSSTFGFVPEAKLAAAVLTNASSVPAADVWLAAVNTALDMPIERKRSYEPSWQAPPGYGERLVGRYRSDEGADIQVTWDKRGLTIALGGEEFDLRLSGPDTAVYNFRGQERLVRFFTRHDGQAWALFHGNSMTGIRLIRKV
jgi:CubicO group peptidase (beta-lactamase class C family)